MTDKLPERQLRRLFPNAPESFIKSNSDIYRDTRVSSESKQLDKKSMEKTCRSEEIRKVDRKCFIQVVFYAGHGQELDEDNRRYIAKPILDALVNLGFSATDQNFTSEVTQRMDENNINI